MIQFALNALAALIGALAAGAIGVYFGLARFRRERAFDRRLEWHVSAVRTLTIASARLNHVANVKLLPELQEEIESAMQEAINAMPGPQFELEAEMFASRSSFEAIREAFEDQRRIVGSFLALSHPDTTVDSEKERIQLGANMLRITAKSMLHAASRLASDVRGFLHLGDVKRETRLYDEKHRRRFRRSSEEALSEFLSRMHSDKK